MFDIIPLVLFTIALFLLWEIHKALEDINNSISTCLSEILKVLKKK